NLRRPSDMDSAHGELRARLADGLRRDNAYGFANVHRRAAREVAAVALAAYAVRQLTVQDGTHPHLLDVGVLDPLGDIFADLLAAFDDHLAGLGMLHILRRGAAQDALRQRRDHLPTVDFGLDGDPLLGAAIFGRDDAVVRDVHQAAGEIARVRCFARSVGQPLARAIRRVEVL